MDAMIQLLEIMERLRDPDGGCPWDQSQTFDSISAYTLEEAYEVADAIQRGDMAELRDELGDLLFQIAFYSQLAKEQGYFSFSDVASGICDKMIRRHPHVFDDAEFVDDEQLHQAWEVKKAEERADRAATAETSQMDGVALALPALVRAEKLQKRAALIGFDWPEAKGAIDKVREELDEVEAEMDSGDTQHLQEELGDLLFAMVNVIRLLGMHAEPALTQASRKFEQRFRTMEQMLRSSGVTDMRDLSLTELDDTWEKVKQGESGN